MILPVPLDLALVEAQSGRSTVWQPLKPILVIEAQSDRCTGGRFRHSARLLRWRPGKKPSQCTMVRVERQAQSPLNLLEVGSCMLGSRRRETFGAALAPSR